MLEISVGLGAIATILAFIYRESIKKRITHYRVRRNTENIVEQKTRAIDKAGLSQFKDTTPELKFGGISNSRYGAVFIDPELYTLQDIEEELDEDYLRASMIGDERKIFPKELSWQDSVFEVMNYFVCKEEGKRDKAQSIEIENASENPKKHNTLKKVWKNDNWTNAIEEAERRVSNYDLSEACIDEYLFLLKKWSVVTFQTLEVYSYDYAVGKVLDEGGNFALLGRGGRKEVAENAVEKICEEGQYEITDKKETSWPPDNIEAVAIIIEDQKTTAE